MKTASRLTMTFAFLVSMFLTAAVPQERPAPDVPNQAKALVEILKDDRAREALIKELEKLDTIQENKNSDIAETDAKNSIQPSVVQGSTPLENLSLGRRLANFTKESSEAIAATVETLRTRLAETARTLGALGRSDTNSVLWDAIKSLFFIILVTYAIFIGLRTLVKPLYRKLGAHSANGGFISTIVAVLISVIVDAGVVILAWGLGYVSCDLRIGRCRADRHSPDLVSECLYDCRIVKSCNQVDHISDHFQTSIAGYIESRGSLPGYPFNILGVVDWLWATSCLANNQPECVLHSWPRCVSCDRSGGIADFACNGNPKQKGSG